jgi:FtsP/CotA-like multicopper oxidase with cupredoxin domain
MAGFLIVEGDVDEALNLAMTGESWPDPEIRTGPFDYRERLVFVQRVFVQTVDLDVGPLRNALRFPPFIAVNGVKPADVIFMRPGAVERWRVLNGSVDGAGTKRYMILRGQYVHRDEKLWRVVTEGEGASATKRLERVTQKELEKAKMPFHQLSFDGITLVTERDGVARHVIRDLSLQNAHTENPFTVMSEGGEDDPREQLRAYESCFKDGESLRRAFVRPNELYLGNANRADVFFKAPLDSAGETYTIFAQEAHIHTDNFQFELQRKIRNPDRNKRRPLFDVVVAYVHVRGEPVEGGDFDGQGLNDKLPPVPPLLQAVKAEELVVPDSEARQTGVEARSARTRVISYSGMGGADFPLVEVPEDFARERPELKDLVWGEHEGVKVLLPNLTRTMAINTEFDLASKREPDVPRKFMPDDPRRSRVLVDTAEEWALYNCSQMLWSNTDRKRFPQPGSYGGHFRSYPITRAEGQRRFWKDPQFRITNKGADHPFHIHINPMWVLRIDVPDENGHLHNILPEPQWMDTVSIPRNGGRVVFRTRFDDFVGTWVHHCHILLHEDMGMMQVVECTNRAEETNYKPRDLVASPQMSGDEVDAVYPPPSLDQMYRQNIAFIDPNEIGYQEYPDFEFKVPKLDDHQDD